MPNEVKIFDGKKTGEKKSLGNVLVKHNYNLPDMNVRTHAVSFSHTRKGVTDSEKLGEDDHENREI
jgi:hypothetical protein